jgi:hypothetical protein
MSAESAALTEQSAGETSTPRDAAPELPISRDIVRETFSTWEAATSSPDLKLPRAAGSETHAGDGAQATASAANLNAPVSAPDADASLPSPPAPTANVAQSEPLVKQRRRSVAIMEDNVRPRVEKLRDASMGVLEDASEDSGLRFVLVAIALFLVALLFLILMKTLQ